MKPKQGSTTTTICSCFEFKHDDLDTLVQADPGLTFENLLLKTGVGSKCTACLLDLEFAYSEAKSRSGNGLRGSHGRVARRRPTREFDIKRKLYSLVDSLAPRVPLKLISILPVPMFPDLTCHIRMANRSLLFEGKSVAPPFRLDLNVRGPDGRTVDRITSIVEPERSVRVDVSHPLREGPVTIVTPTCGSVEVVQTALEDGIRGTRRPQIELMTQNAVAALHGQAPNRFEVRAAFVVVNKPKDERTFVTVVNQSDTTRRVDLEYPAELMNSSENAVDRVRIEIPPRGARIHELTLSENAARQLSRPVFTVRWRADPFVKLHRVGASASFDSFSIDHL